ncbi:MAG: bacterial Ig-like domain-containing protein [Acutalibacteraceae bacterium]|jgi:hypothetical protein
MFRFIKRMTGALCAVLLLGGLIPVCISAEPDFASEGYTAISTPADLDRLVRGEPDGKFYLANDIVFKPADFEKGGAYYNGGALWKPIGPTYAQRFSGILDGNGHTVSGLKVAVSGGDSDSAYGGLFGYSSGVIRNLQLLNASISVSDCTYGYAGGLAGAASGTIADCVVQVGSVTVKDAATVANAGGLVGRMYAGTVSNVYNSAAVRAQGTMAVAGGIVANANATLSSVMNRGTVSAKSSKSDAYAGGVIGINDGTAADLLNRGAIDLAAGVDGFAGGIVGANRSSFKQAVNLGAITMAVKSHLYGGAVAGQSTGTFSGCYYLDSTYETAVTESTQKATAVTYAQLKDKTKFSALDFGSVWALNNDGPVPQALASVRSALTSITVSPAKATHIEGQRLQPADLTVTAHYEDGTSKKLNTADFVVADYDNVTTGKKSVTITYGGCTATVEVTVRQKILTGISIGTLPRTVFGQNEEFDVNGGLIAAKFDNGTTVNFQMKLDMISGVDTSKMGKQTVKVTFEYQGKTLTTSYDITVQKDPPPTTSTSGAASGVTVTGTAVIGTGVTDSGEDTLDDDDDADDPENDDDPDAALSTAPDGGANSKDGEKSASLWIAIGVTLAALLAAGIVVLLRLRKPGRHAKPSDPDPGENPPDDPADDSTRA